MKQETIYLILKIGLAVACLATLALSLLPGSYIPKIQYLDKLVHFSGYAILAFLARLSLRSPSGWLLAVCCIVFSFAIEILQSYVPNRGFEWLDLLANSLGVFTGLCVAKFTLYLGQLSRKETEL